MKPLDTLAAIVATIVWGLTFIGIKYGIEEAPPFLLTAMRFACAAVPLVFFVPAPRAPWRLVALYGALIGIGQFGLLFSAMRLGMPVGLASIAIQMQVYFTMALAALILRERPTRAQALGAAVALAGMALIAWARWSHAAVVPLGLTLLAALSWSGANIVGKRLTGVDPLALVAWSSLVAPVPMFALSAAVEPARTFAAAFHPSLRLILSVAFIGYGGTVLSYSVWARLLARYSASAVAPFALLVPVVGLAAGALMFGERSNGAELAGAMGVLIGLAINVFGTRIGGAELRRRAA